MKNHSESKLSARQNSSVRQRALELCALVAAEHLIMSVLSRLRHSHGNKENKTQSRMESYAVICASPETPTGHGKLAV